MSPRVAKKDRGDVPKPVVKEGSLGFFPVKNLPLACLCQERCDAVIGIHDRTETLYLKEHSKLKLKQGTKTETVDVSGCIFNGFSDAFYRGKLPQVIVAVPDLNQLNDFIEEFLHHLEKMCALGFFIQKPDPVGEMIPCFVVASNGIFFNSMIRKLLKGLENIDALSEALIRRIVERFTRGILNAYPPCPLTASSEQYVQGETLVACEPLRMTLAGGSYQTQMIIQNVLSGHGMIASIESSVENAAERVEFENAISRVSYNILPALVGEKALSKKDAKALQENFEKAVFSIGQHRKAFEDFENLEQLIVGKKEAESPVILDSDKTLLVALEKYADHLGLYGEKAVFEALEQKLSSES